MNNNDKHGLITKDGASVNLQQIIIKANIIDFIAKVKLVQTYENTLDTPVEAIYKVLHLINYI